MRNLLAIIVGVITTILMLTFVIYILAYFNIGPCRQIMSSNFNYDTLRVIAKYFIFIIFPISSFVAAFVASLIANNKEICGIASILPLIIIAFKMPSVYLLLAVVTIILSMIAGIMTTKHIKL